MLFACERTTEAPPASTDAELGRDFLPVAVGSFWIYDVVNHHWNYNEDSVERFQFRERVDTVFQGATGELNYRIVRARRADSTNALGWRDDTAFALVLTPQLARRTFANRPTVELIFPVRQGTTWNPNLFNSLVSTERRYADLDQPLTLPDGQQFAQTVRVVDAGEDNLFFLNESVSTYARGVGLIRRVRRKLDFCQGNDSASTGCSVGSGFILRGQEREETLREYGPHP